MADFGTSVTSIVNFTVSGNQRVLVGQLSSVTQAGGEDTVFVPRLGSLDYVTVVAVTTAATTNHVLHAWPSTISTSPNSFIIDHSTVPDGFVVRYEAKGR